VAKNQGYSRSTRGPGAGPLQCSCVEPMRLWHLEFDGVAQPVSQEENSGGILYDGIVEPLKFDIVMEGGGPIWDLNARAMEKQTWAHAHWEQLMIVRGQIKYRGKTVILNGQGLRDHSPGARNYGPVVSDFWCPVRFPSGKGFMAQQCRTESVGEDIRGGYIYRADGTPLEMVELVEGPRINERSTPDRSVYSDMMLDPVLKEFRIVLKSKRGLEVIDGELLHTGATTYVAPNEELIGTDFSRLQDSQLQTCVARYRWDGETGWGVRERIARIHTLR
jgi:hypothetical protein